jgi:palmitoyltransferase
MRIRSKLYPRALVDWSASVFFVIMIPLTYWFEVFVVLPMYYAENPTCYACHSVFATYLLVNVVGNMVAVFLIDSSVRGVVLPSRDVSPKWQFCDVCECFTPPRSWHCNTCDICILKRDHHCHFTASCIGHNNQRYFIMFLLYFTFSCAYCTFYNTYFLWTSSSFQSYVALLKLVFPLAVLVTGLDYSMEQYYRLICVLTIIGLLTGLCLSIYHGDNLLKGRVIHERVKNISTYDAGCVVDNLKMVFGNRWYLTWFWPFVTSELPHDGINWDTIPFNSLKKK